MFGFGVPSTTLTQALEGESSLKLQGPTYYETFRLPRPMSFGFVTAKRPHTSWFEEYSLAVRPFTYAVPSSMKYDQIVCSDDGTFPARLRRSMF
jgi:hypothetical protein